jgi:hypothetical protein
MAVDPFQIRQVNRCMRRDGSCYPGCLGGSLGKNPPARFPQRFQPRQHECWQSCHRFLFRLYSSQPSSILHVRVRDISGGEEAQGLAAPTRLYDRVGRSGTLALQRLPSHGESSLAQPDHRPHGRPTDTERTTLATTGKPLATHALKAMASLQPSESGKDMDPGAPRGRPIALTRPP